MKNSKVMCIKHQKKKKERKRKKRKRIIFEISEEKKKVFHGTSLYVIFKFELILQVPW